MAIKIREIPYRDPMCLVEDEAEDDEPLATDGYYREQIYVYDVLYERLAGPGCYVSFQRWLRRDSAGKLPPLQPDILVAIGVPNALRRVYNPWDHGRPPKNLAEWLSDWSLAADRTKKPEAYRELGISEYWPFNPYGEFADPRIQGWDLLAPGEPAPFTIEPDGSIRSRALPVRFVVRESLLEALDAATGESLSPRRAQELRIMEEISRREREREARIAAERRTEQERVERAAAEHRAELERIRQQRAGTE